MPQSHHQHSPSLDSLLETASLDQLLQVSWAITLSIYTCSGNVQFRYVTVEDEVDGTSEAILQAVVSHDTRFADIIRQTLSTMNNGGNAEHAQSTMTSMKRQTLSQDNWTLLSAPESSDEDGESRTSSPSQSVELKVRDVFQKPQHPSFQLAVDIIRLGGSQEVLLEFQVPNAPDAQISNMLRTFEYIFNDSLSKPDAIVKELDVCSAEDVAQIASWNQTVGSNTNEESILDCICKFATTEPTLSAVDSWDGQLSYVELDELSSKLAAHLIEMGLSFYPRETKYVPILFEKSLRAVVAMVAVMRIGCAFVLLEPSQPVQRLQAICSELTPSLVICSAACTEVAETLAPSIVSLDSDFHTALWARPPQPLISVQKPRLDHALYAVFTSGSTGKPKGITIDHDAFLSCARAYVQKVGMDKHTRTLQFASYAFDVSISDTLNSLLVGGCLCIPSELERSSGIADGIRRLKPTWADLTPSLLRHLRLEDLHTIRTIVLSGEALPRDVIDSWGGQIRLINVYGPAECSVQSTLCTAVSTDSASNIGHAIVGATWIVDPSDHEKLRPIGAVGELLIEGPHLGRGYINEPIKTQAAFIPAPSWLKVLRDDGQDNSPGRRRLYCTGDLVHYQLDGSLRYIGRKDTQVKLRGQRVELEEVEHHLRESFPPGTNIVAEVIAMSHEKSASSALVAFLTGPNSPHQRDGEVDFSPVPLLEKPHSSLAEQVSAAREKLQASVPEYMIPTLFLSAHHLPLTASGKLDRRQLSEVVSQLSREALKSFTINTNDDVGRTVSTELERKLLRVFARVLNLKLDGIALDDDFFALGGDSITAMRVVAQCRQEGFVLETGDILRHRTIPKIAAAAKSDSSPPTASQLTPGEELIHTPFGLSPIQRMFFADSPNGDNYFNQSLFVAASCEIDFLRLNIATVALVNRHSMLRARFNCSENGIWTQWVTNDILGSFKCHQHQLSTREQVTEVMKKSQTELNLQTGPILLLDLFRIDGDSYPYLFITTHHAVIDLVSYRILLEDLEELLDTGKLSSPETPIPFQWWCRLQAEYSQTKLHPEIAFPCPLDINTDAIDQYWALDGVKNTYGNSQSTPLLIDEPVTRAILTTANKAFRTQPVEILNAALLHSFLRVFSDRSPPTIFNEGHGREPWDPSIDLSRTIGWFTTIWPTAVDYSQYTRGDAVDLVRRVKDARRAVVGNGMPYFASRHLNEQGIEVFGKQKMEIVFNFHGQFQQFERDNSMFQHVPWEYEHSSDYGADTVLPGLFEITCVVVQGRLQFEFIYGKELAHQDKISEWIQECGQSLGEIADRLSSSPVNAPTLTDLPLLSLGYSDLDRLTEVLPEFGVCWVDVEDIYPCLPMQEGILLSQAREAALYQTGSVLEFRKTGSGCIDINLLHSAWAQVVNRHSVLRTILSPTGLSSHSFNSIVLQPGVAPLSVSTVKYEAYEDKYVERMSILDMLQKSRERSQPPALVPYHIELYASSNPNSVFCDITFNHAIMDGWSSSVLIKDWVAAYNGCLESKESTQYGDYVSYVLGKESSLGYWQEYLAQTECCLFPTLVDHGDTCKNELYNVDIDIGESDENLRDSLKAHGATVSNLYLVAWALLLKSYTGSENVCFGYLTSGRDAPIPGIEEAVGLFANLLPCRFNFTSNDSPLSLLQDSQSDLAQALSHQHISMSEIMTSLNLFGQALFNTVVSIQSRVEDPETDGCVEGCLTVEELEEVDPTEYGLALNVYLTGNKVKAYISCWTSMVSPWQAKHIADTLSHIVWQILASPGESIVDLRLLGSQQRDILEARACKMPIAIDDCVHDVFRRQVWNHPKAAAVCAWDGDLSYQQLDEASSLIAQSIRNMGIGVGNWVGLFFERSQWVPIAMLATMKSGAAFVLLESSYPITRLQQICNDANVTVVLTANRMSEKARCIQENIIIIDDTQQSVSRSSDKAAPTTPTPRDALYAIFTSGSTGKPKGVVIEHGAYASSAFAHASIARYTPQSRVFQFSSYAFDACMAEILTTLLFGGCICIPSEDDKWNDLPGSLARLQANHLFLVPSMLRNLDPQHFPSVKTVIVGGEPLSLRETQKWADQTHLIQVYGPSECSVYCTVTDKLQITSDVRDTGTVVGSIPWIVDPLNVNVLAPIGAVGELILEGPIVGREYLNNPEQSAAAFIDPPSWRRSFSCYPKRRLYRTGDLVQYTKHNRIRVIGRKDTQVKLRGQRMELGEVEHCLHDLLPRCPHIIVEMIKFEDVNRPTMLVALLEGEGDIDEEKNGSLVPGKPASSSQDDSSVLQTMEGSLKAVVESARPQLLNRLPYYMIPDVFLAIKKLPVSAAGKADRKRLRSEAATLIQSGALESDQPNSEGKEFVAMTPAERKILELVGEALGRSPSCLSVEDNFFKVGGDSLRAMKLVQLARSQNFHLSMSDIFRAPQISAMAAVVGVPEEKEDARSPVTPNIVPFSLLSPENRGNIIREVAERAQIDQAEIEDIYPCTSLQEGMISLSLRSPSAYVAQSIYVLPPDCDLARLKEAWGQVVKANSILRTRIFQTDSDGALQVVLHHEPEWLETSNLEIHLKRDQKMAMGLMDSLLRLAVISETKDESISGSETNYMVVTIHHALYDGWSEGLILDQVAAVYSGQTISPCQFAPFIKYIRDTQHLAKEFWQREMADLEVPSAVFPPSPLPNHLPDPTASLSSRMDLAEGHTSSHFTLSSQLRLCWALVISHFTTSEYVVFGVIVNGRGAPIPGIEDITGPTLATLPCRVNLTSSQTIENLLSEVQENSGRMLPFEQFGLQNIRALSETAAMQCQFQNLLVLQPPSDSNRSQLLSQIDHPEASAKFDTYPLTMQCTMNSDHVELLVNYDSQIISEKMMSRVVDHFKHVFKEMAYDTTRKVAQITSTSPEDMAQLKGWYHELQQRQPQASLVVHEVIARQCQFQPTAAAVNAWDGDFSYHEVDQLSSALAVHLAQVGVELESIVPVCFEKSKWLPVIMLAILKAGATFVLLDPSSQPLQRLQLIVEEVKGKVVITSETLLSSALQLSGAQPVIVSDNAHFLMDNINGAEVVLLPAVTGRNALYTIFTSGSTGKPKGVVIEHGGYTAGALSRQKVTGLNSNSRVLQFSSCAFDTFITDILDTLIAGACICIPSESERNANLSRVALDMRVTYADLVPSVARVLNPCDIPTLETLSLSGEPLATVDIALWAPKVKLCNLYGPAECSAVATGHVVSEPDVDSSNIGRGCGGVCWVVNPADHEMLLPIGAIGELVLEGPIVGRGYLGEVQGPASSNFLQEPPVWRHAFPHSQEDCRMYKTGDLVQYNADGTVLFIGRKDNQVKLRGQRLELGDVEHHLRSAFPACLDVVADLTGESASKKHLVAFVVMGETEEQQESEQQSDIRKMLEQENVHITSTREFRGFISEAEKFLRSTLPGFMVPTAYFSIRSLPRVPSGKADRRRLRQAASDLIAYEGLEPFTAVKEKRSPSTATEKRLQEIWAQVLGRSISTIGAEDGFLQLGGDSISAMKVAAIAMSEGLHLSTPKLFQNESLQTLAATAQPDQAVQSIDWAQEVSLPPDMTAPTDAAIDTASSLHPVSPTEVLLTGATGSLGREILQQLTESPDIKVIHCVAVRSPEQIQPHEKIRIYKGDLSIPRLGMSEPEEAVVVKQCHAIIHCGARVSFVQNYETMRATNVDSTKYLTGLALKSSIPFHYISTIGVGREESQTILDEVSAARSPPPTDSSDGYTLTKWVSESFLENVNAQFGLPIVIHRPSNIISDGAPETDIVNSLVKYSRRMRLGPQLKSWEGYFDLIQGRVVASNIIGTVMATIEHAATSQTLQHGVRYIHESGEAIFPVDGFSTYLEEMEQVPFETVSLTYWIENALQQGMAKLVGDFLRETEESGETISLPLIKSSRQP